MGFMDRLGQIASGFGHAAGDIGGFGKDLAVGGYDALKDEDFTDFTHALIGGFISNGSQLLQHLFGPQDSVVGGSIGGLPDIAREPFRYTVKPVLQGNQWLYSHAVSHPLATLLTVGALAQSPQWGKETGDSQWGSLFDPHAWGDAYSLSRHRSVGQAMAISLDNIFSGDDVLDQGAMNKFEGSDWYKLISGTTDFAFQKTFDPISVVAGPAGYGAVAHAEEGSLLSRVPLIGGHDLGELPLSESHEAIQSALSQAKAAGEDITDPAVWERAAQAGRDAGTTARQWQIDRYLASDRWARLDGAIQKAVEAAPDVNSAIGSLRDTVFSRAPAGVQDLLSSAMGQTTGAMDREFAMRVALGDNTAINLLQESGNTALSEFLRNKFEDSNFMKPSSYLEEYHNTQAFRPDVHPDAVAQSITSDPQYVERLNNVRGVVNKGLAANTGARAALNHLKNSEFYQTSATLKPVRVFFNKAPMLHIAPEDPGAVNDLDGMMRQAGMLSVDRQPIIGKFLSTSDPVEKKAIFLDAEQQALGKIADRHGMTTEQVQEMMDQSRQYKGAAQDLLNNAPVDETGRKVVTLPGFGDEESAQVPITPSASGNDFFVAPMKQLDRYLGRQGTWRAGAMALPNEVMNDMMNIWRPFTLIRPAWPLRVVGDHSLLMLAKMRGLSYGLPFLRKEIGNYASFRDALKEVTRQESEQLGLKWGTGVGAALGGLTAGPIGALAGAGLGYGFQRLARNIGDIQYPQLMVNGWLTHEAWGNGVDQREMWKGLVSNRRDLETGMGRFNPGHVNIFNRLAEGEGRTFLPGDLGYTNRWTKTIQSIQSDPMAKMILAQDHLDEALQGGVDGSMVAKRWLQGPQGQAYIEKNPIVASDPDKYIANMRMQIHDLTMNDPRIAAKIAKGQKVTIDDLNQAAMDENGIVDLHKMPAVHQEQIAQAVGRSKITRRVNNVIQQLYTSLGQLPTDVLVNQRFFAMNYASEMERMLSGLGGGTRLSTEAEIHEAMRQIFGAPFEEFLRRKASGVQDFNDMAYRFGEEDPGNEVWMKNDVIPKFTADEGTGLGMRRADITGEWENGKRIPLNRVVSTQPEITPTGVAHAVNMHNMSEGQYPIVEQAGRYYILRDGNHRVTYNMLRGDKEIVADVMPSSFMEPAVAEKAIRDSYVAGRDVRIPLEAPGKISQETIDGLENNARYVALARTRKTMYDFADRSEFADMMRHVMPFFPAWQQTIQRWASVAAENPDYIRKAQMMLQIPGKMGATWKDPDTGEEYIRFRLPSFARALVDHGFLKGALDDQGYARFQLKGLSPALGAPGFGPWVDVALQPFVHSHPELTDSLKTIFPYGVSDNVMQAFMPPNVTKFQSATEGDGKSYRSAYNRILITDLVKMETGEMPKLDLNNAANRAQFLSEVNSKARAFSAFRLVSGLLSPISGLQYDSPYEPLLEIYRNLEKTDPATAQDKFLQEFGDEYFALTQSFTKLNNGIPPTIQGQADYEKYKSLIQQFPDLGTLITGEEGGGSPVQFSQAAYNKQLITPIRPGSNIMQRQELSPEEIIANSDSRLGWIQFTRAMDLIDAMMSQRGLSNLNVKAATDLRFAKDTFISAIAQQHPQWYQDYQQMDENKWTNRIAGMQAIVQDPRLSQRPDIVELKKYLELRQALTAELATRKSKTLGASSNADLSFFWDNAVQMMKNESLAFSNLYNRWLNNDPVTPVGTGTNIPTIGVGMPGQPGGA